MPIGIIINCLSVFCGAFIGSIVGRRLSGNFKETITLILGISAISIGVNNLIKAVNTPPIILAIILGTSIGYAFHLESAITKGFGYILSKVSPRKNPVELSNYVTVVVLFLQ